MGAQKQSDVTPAGVEQPPSSSPTTAPRSSPFAALITAMRNPKDPFAAQALRTLSYISTGAAELGEILTLMSCDELADTTAATFDATREHWYKSWTSLARNVCNQGELSEHSGHKLSAASSYLRATEYYRQSAFFLRENLEDKRLIMAISAVRQMFKRHATCAGIPIEYHQIPYHDSSYLHSVFVPATATAPPPPASQTPPIHNNNSLVIVFPGYDSCIEEAWYTGGEALWRRGHSVLLVEGPGQNATLVLNKLYFRADYEVVLDAIGSWLYGGENNNKSGGELSSQELQGLRSPLPGINQTTKIALFSRSFGGYLGLRMAAGSRKIKLVAVAVDPLQVGFRGMERKLLSIEEIELLHARDEDSLRKLDEILVEKCKISPLFRFTIMSRAAAHGLSTRLSEWMAQMAGPCSVYEVDHAMLSQMKCPVWTSSSPNENISAQIDEHIKNSIPNLTVQEFSEQDGALAHCEAGGTQRLLQCVCDWLDEHLGG